MDTSQFFFTLLLILVGARLLAELAVRLQAPAVIGELLAGVLLGPSLLGWVEPEPAIRLLAEIGIILLLFEVGLDTDVRRLGHTGLQSAIVALTGFFAPLLAGAALAWWVFGLSPLVSLFIGGTLTATSIGITVRVLGDLGRQRSREGQIVLGAAVLDDVLGVVLLALLYEFVVSGEVSLANAGRVLAFICAFFLLAPVAARAMSLLIKRHEGQTSIPGLIPTAIVSLVLFFAWLSHAVGAPELLGGFAAGLALSRRFFLPFGIALHTDESFSQRIEQQMFPIIRLFTPIFFVTVGLSLNLQAVDWTSPFIWSFSLLMLLAAVVTKLLGAVLLPEPPWRRWMIGTAMVPRGEVGLIFAELGRVNGLFTDAVYAGLIIVIALTTLVPPFVMKAWYARAAMRPRS
ncbi:MAG: cation:proton antiporter [Gammaproteobacteria bacterium]|nr:MAG: cation:proton antiporter [Gammaproteobacteria bacterium]